MSLVEQLLKATSVC